MSGFWDRDRLTLSDVGEFRLLAEIVFPALASVASPGLGDDCSSVAVPGVGKIVVSSDAAPRPLVMELGHTEMGTWGWYAGLVAVSDIAAVGARPIALSTSVEAPADMDVRHFRDFFDGLHDFCAAHNVPVAGGNLREGKSFACHGTAIGFIDDDWHIGRGACAPGDLVYSVGECGLFASAYVRAITHGIESVDAHDFDRLVRPTPRIREMRQLRAHRLITAASDNTDGLAGTIWNLASASNCGIELELSEAMIPQRVLEAAAMINADPWNLMFFWGDWQVLVAVPAGIDGENHLQSPLFRSLRGHDMDHSAALETQGNSAEKDSPRRMAGDGCSRSRRLETQP